MKNLCLSLFLLICSFMSSAQFHHNLELGGSNFTGFSFTTEYHFSLTEESAHYQPYRFYISPKLGLGHIFWWDHAMTAQAGLAFGLILKKENWLEFNSNASYIFPSPFVPQNRRLEYLYMGPEENRDFIWYNGFDYKIMGNKAIYTIGCGATTLVERMGRDMKYQIFGDFIPMLKLGIGL